jgi:nucleoside-diphosphate-sugar epimerase
MRVLLTGGAGDLGYTVSKQLAAQGDVAIRLDVRAPADDYGVYIAGSILDRATLAEVMKDVDCVVHIAAWHGLHEVRREKDVYDFWDLNVTGTFYVFEAAVRAGITRMVYISSTSIEERDGVYGHTKVLGEEIARTYAARHHMNVITLRPRAFIPYWNKVVYNSYVEWAKWFWGGAVHIDDVTQAVMQSIKLLSSTTLNEHVILTLDGAYDYSDQDLENWDAEGAGSTFRKYYPDYYDLVVGYGLDPALKPEKRDITDTQRWLGYQPTFGLRNLLEELKQYGEDGPPRP